MDSLVTHKTIPGHPNYSAGDDGTIWRNRCSGLKRMKDWVHRGYRCIYLRIGKGKRRMFSVHALIAKTFLGPQPAGTEVCHNNGIKTDCRAENLRWGTKLDNHLDRVKHGSSQLIPGAGAGNKSFRWTAGKMRKLTPANFAYIVSMKGIVTQKDLAK
jgi:hypothetical protein